MFPAFILVSTLSALSYLSTTLSPAILSKLESTTIPPLSESSDSPIGDVLVVVEHCRIASAASGPTSFARVRNDSVNIAIPSMDTAFSCDWSYRKQHWPHIRDHGSVTVHASDAALYSVFDLFVAKNGQGQVKAVQCAVNLVQFEFKLHGGASWLYNFFIKLFRRKITDHLQEALNADLCSAIAVHLDSALEALPVSVTLPRVPLGIDYALTKNPRLDVQSGLVLESTGLFYAAAKKKPLRPCAKAGQAQLPAPSRSNMLQLSAGTCLFQSIADATFESGMLSILIDNQSLPPGSYFSLTTDWFGILIPQILEKYGAGRNMSMLMYATQPPQVDMVNRALAISQNVYINVSVTHPDVQVFTLGTTFAMTASVEKIDIRSITPSFSFVKASTTVVSSTVGRDWAPTITELASDSLEYMFIPFTNAYVKSMHGFAFPTIPGASLTSAPVVSWISGSFVVEGNFTLHQQEPHAFVHL